MKGKIAVIIVIAAIAVLAWKVFSPAPVEAGYPMISDIPNQKIPINSSTPVIQFTIYDDITTPDNLKLTYRSENPDLVPESDDNITLGGSGKNRTVQITPSPGKWGMAPIIIIVTDTDGDTNRDAFEVDVVRPPQ